MGLILKEIAELIGGRIIGDETIMVDLLKPFDEAEENDITFAADEKYLKNIGGTKAKAVIIPDIDIKCDGKSFIVVNGNPRNQMPAILNFFKPKIRDMLTPIESDSDIHFSCKISPNVYIGHNVKIGANTTIYPNCAILEGVSIGENCIIYPNVTIREYCKIGDNVILQPGVVIGSDGFGYVFNGKKHLKLEQIGRVVLEDDVEIGANSTVDRGAIGDTVIKSGTKIDNLVQIGHNDKIGSNCIIVSQVGISGSVKLGDNVVLGGQVGVAGHLTIGDNCVVAAKSGVTNDVPENSKMSGFPLREHRDDLKIKIAMTKLPEILKRLTQLEKKVGDTN